MCENAARRFGSGLHFVPKDGEFSTKNVETGRQLRKEVETCALRRRPGFVIIGNTVKNWEERGNGLRRGIQMIYVCDSCNFLFDRAGSPEQCPDCGKYAIRPAGEGERREYAQRLSSSQEPQASEVRPAAPVTYDDEVFFRKYSQMDRSRKGLDGAGEWHELQKLLPDFQGKSVLDLGCGYGWHCKYAAGQGAARVLGVDLSARMLAEAAARNGDGRIEYRQGDMEELELPEGSFDVVLSSLAFHYVRAFPALVRNISGWLKPGGEFIFSVEHPVFTAYGSQDWHYDGDGKILHFPVDRYFLEGQRDTVFLGERVRKYHRTLTSYLDLLLKDGFFLRRVVEPQPPEEMMCLPGMRDELRRPMMLLVSAVKIDAGNG